jgi:hypothetical protein
MDSTKKVEELGAMEKIVIVSYSFEVKMSRDLLPWFVANVKAS